MLIIDVLHDDNSWQGTEVDVECERQRPADDDALKACVSKCIVDELDEKMYHPALAMYVSQSISKAVLRKLAERHPSYKVIVHTFVDRKYRPEHHRLRLAVSCHFDSRIDSSVSVIESNAHM